LLCSALWASPRACHCHHPGLNALLVLIREGISVPRGPLVLETGDVLTLLDPELAGVHLHQHHLPSFHPAVLLSRSSFCSVSYSHFSSLLSHLSYLLFSFQHFNSVSYTFAPAWSALLTCASSLGLFIIPFSCLYFATSSSDLLKYFFSS